MNREEHDELYKAIQTVTNRVRLLQLAYPDRRYTLTVECDEDDVSVHITCKPPKRVDLDREPDPNLAKLVAQQRVEAEAEHLAQQRKPKHTGARGGLSLKERA